MPNFLLNAELRDFVLNLDLQQVHRSHITLHYISDRLDNVFDHWRIYHLTALALYDDSMYHYRSLFFLLPPSIRAFEKIILYIFYRFNSRLILANFWLITDCRNQFLHSHLSLPLHPVTFH
jgi:hypothetical protein